LAVFLTADPLIVNLKASNPRKGTCINRNTTFEPLSVQFEPKLRPKKRKKRINGGRRKSQNRYISPPRGGAISQPIFTKCGEFVDLTDIITPAKFGYKVLIGFSRPRGGKSHFPNRKHMAYITKPCATALACDGRSRVTFAAMSQLADMVSCRGRVTVNCLPLSS